MRHLTLKHRAQHGFDSAGLHAAEQDLDGIRLETGLRGRLQQLAAGLRQAAVRSYISCHAGRADSVPLRSLPTARKRISVRRTVTDGAANMRGGDEVGAQAWSEPPPTLRV